MRVFDRDFRMLDKVKFGNLILPEYSIISKS